MEEMGDVIRGIFSEELIKAAAARAVVEAPLKIMASIRKKPLILELRVENEMIETQRQQIQELSGDYRYDFITTSTRGRIQIFGCVPKEEVKNYLDRVYQEDGKFRVEIYHGQSEASIEEIKKAYW